MPDSGSIAARGLVSADSPNTDVGSITSAQDGYDPQQILALARHPPPGASVYSPSAIPSSALNPRSCVTCRRRKVRCDKHMPCSNCCRAQIPCIFPAPGRAPRRPRPKDPNAPAKQPSSERELELMRRLRKLEGIVEELSGQIEVETGRPAYSAGNSPEGTTMYSGGQDHQTPGGRPIAPALSNSNINLAAGVTTPDVPKPPTRTISQTTLSEPDRLGKLSPDVHKQFGRLMLNERGGTRYVSSGLWSSITDELNEIRRESQNIHDESEDSDDEATPESSEHVRPSVLSHQSWIMGYSSADVDLRPLHPLPSQIPFIWQVFQENVDPILKVLHVPSMNKLIRDYRRNLDTLTPSTEALMFSIYYASITSLDEDEVRRNFDAEKDTLLQKYRFALEQALGRSNLLTTPDLVVAQAFLLFLVLVRRHDDTRFAWTLTGLLIRISQALGLHRDGTHFDNITPFEIEMRRRLFWAVCVLDLRSAEDQGTDLTVVEQTFDTQYPMNINDTDISPESTCLPEPRVGTTDMTFSLIRYEMCSLARSLHTMSSAMATVNPRDAISLEEREKMLVDTQRRVEEQYLKDSSEPMYWAAANITRVICAKMMLVIYQPVLFPGPGNEYLTDEVRARLFNASLEVFEYAHILNTDERCKQWRWLFQTYSQWHAVAYTLIEVSHRPWGPKAERAWAALNLRFAAPNSAELEKLAGHHAVWLPLRKLYDKASKHRAAEVTRLQNDPDAARELELRDRCNTTPTSIREIPGSVKRVMALERWRKLVNAPPLPQELVDEQAEKQTQQREQSERSGLQQQQQLPNQNHPMQQQLQNNGVRMATKPEVMDYIDSAMSNSTPFVTTDFAPLFYGDIGDFTQTQSFGYPPAGLDFNTAPTPNYGNPTVSLGTPVQLQPQQQRQQASQQQQQHQHQQQQQQGMLQSPQHLEQLPPWMWPTNAGSPDFLRMPNMGSLDDVDMNVDEGFDWQNWQESLGKYELETTGGRTSSTWGPGI
ncbi:fungal-specific transcription factor domain-containing protein [Apiosordaria backusii]|uniref:Fungal-specific transcription factor domain-containing protein n=1 Tax=Apiosordaria backusii TaxID=314023 RepID=A0AA40E8T6_9PEZI|nr:fungal-specific transcription factor domain-containing protein [Apiosordaria backusii]